MRIEDIVEADFLPLPDILAAHAARRGDATALVDECRRVSWRELDDITARIAAELHVAGIAPREPVALAATNSVEAALVFLGILRAGAAAALLTSSASGETVLAMLEDSTARLLFLDRAMAEKLDGLPLPAGIGRIAVDDSTGGVPLSAWLPPAGVRPEARAIAPEDPFNIIYSSGTTGTPKGIVQSHRMRHEYARRTVASGYGDETSVICSTPLYSNTTLVSFFPALMGGGKVVLMGKFDVLRFLELSQAERVTHAMLVPVQYRRIMEHPEFDRFDLSSYQLKSSTSAPFPAWLKADVLQRWPGGLLEAYGMTEGGASALLLAHEFPDKLHTVGRVAPGHIMKIIDEQGRELPQGETGEIVGHSPIMMDGYHRKQDKTREAEWFDDEGRRYIRHGDIGRFDEDGFLILMDRAKDLIISGGFNIYPTDLEAELLRLPSVREAAVVGIPSDKWGETPFAVVVPNDRAVDAQAILAEANSRLGKTQRISGIALVDELPRSPIGKVLKRELRDRFGGNPISGALSRPGQP
ncbi:AMP-dependent synthetase and ligase [Novosphingobium nitrogenifigens DSM 19370]|uniref:AMP-dependent synthetase and ligase n=1 Tax=Novosphingobium nitrogenifigens DSM 19370 TaxID=983920 RepID=F1Z6S9_9SPHN|nr:class I adenylate-forming enzyme family protein [Novosphingobium nitrogenifigens]EGD59739.1 AMP-dependent synthetase and ligase [Novosphingobium nitrogenifigens DSM 19370]